MSADPHPIYYRTMPEPVRPAVLVLRKTLDDGHLCAPMHGNRHCFTYNEPDGKSHCDCGAYQWFEQVEQPMETPTLF